MTLPIWERQAPLGTRTPRQIMDDVARLHEHDVEQKAAWPDPEMRATPILLEDLPRGPKAIARLCDEARATIARGPVAAQNKDGWRMATSIMVKGRVGQDRRFVAVWIEDSKGSPKLDLIYAHRAGRLTATALKEYLRGEETS